MKRIWLIGCVMLVLLLSGCGEDKKVTTTSPSNQIVDSKPTDEESSTYLGEIDISQLQ